MIKVLVTGSQGQLGKTIQELYTDNNKGLDFVFIPKKELDITNSNEVIQFFSNNNFDYCINCAAYTNVEQAEKTPALAFIVNAEGVKNMAEACKENNVVLIHISTDYVFDGKKNTPYLETDKTNPINEYGKSKLLGEQYIQEILKHYIIVRTSWLYSTYGNNFLNTIVKKAQNKEPLNVTIDQRGTPTSCVELSKFLIHLIKKNTPFGIYHYSALGETTWHKFALQIAKQFKEYSISNITPVKFFKTTAKRPKYSILSKAKTLKVYKHILHWRKQVNHTVKDFL